MHGRRWTWVPLLLDKTIWQATHLHQHLSWRIKTTFRLTSPLAKRTGTFLNRHKRLAKDQTPAIAHPIRWPPEGPAWTERSYPTYRHTKLAPYAAPTLVCLLTPRHRLDGTRSVPWARASSRCQRIRHPSCPVRPIAPRVSLLASYGDSASLKKSSSLTQRCRVNRSEAKQTNSLDSQQVFRVKLVRHASPSIAKKKTLTQSIQRMIKLMGCLSDSKIFRTTMPFRPRKPSTRATRQNRMEVNSSFYLHKTSNKTPSRSIEQRDWRLLGSIYVVFF